MGINGHILILLDDARLSPAISAYAVPYSYATARLLSCRCRSRVVDCPPPPPPATIHPFRDDVVDAIVRCSDRSRFVVDWIDL